MESIEQYIHRLIASLLSEDVASVQNDLHLREDLGADSLDLAELMTTLGRNFEGSLVFDRKALEITTVGDIVRFIQESQQASAMNYGQ